MPRAEVPTLVDISLTVIALHLCSFSNRFYSTSPESGNYRRSPNKALLDRQHAELNIVRRIYPDSLLEKLQYLYLNEQHRTHDAYGFREITEFLFQGCRNRGFNSREGYKKFLKFLLSEKLENLSLRNADIIKQEVFNALRSCLSLKRISLEACYFTDLQIIRTLPNWRNLLSLNLLFGRCSDLVIMFVYQECPNLETLKATGKLITNNCLFHLCLHHAHSEPFELCPRKGSCCTLAKTLKTLVLYGTEITKAGVACALQHLPLLETFLEGGLEEDRDRHVLVPGIRVLGMECVLNKLPDPILKLHILMSNGYSTIPGRVKDCCPSLDKVVSKLPTAGHDVSFIKDRNNTYSISISSNNRPFYSWLSVEHIIQYMHIYKPVYFCIEDGLTVYHQFHDSYSVELEHCDYHNLEEIHLRFTQSSAFPTGFFKAVLSCAVNVKYLTVSGDLGVSFISAMAINPFSHLEEINFYKADLRYISLESIIRRGLKLKTVSYYRCESETTFASRHRTIARENNFHLEIHESVQIAMCDPPIRFNLI